MLLRYELEKEKRARENVCALRGVPHPLATLSCSQTNVEGIVHSIRTPAAAAPESLGFSLGTQSQSPSVV